MIHLKRERPVSPRRGEELSRTTLPSPSLRSGGGEVHGSRKQKGNSGREDGKNDDSRAGERPHLHLPSRRQPRLQARLTAIHIRPQQSQQPSHSSSQRMTADDELVPFVPFQRSLHSSVNLPSLPSHLLGEKEHPRMDVVRFGFPSCAGRGRRRRRGGGLRFEVGRVAGEINSELVERHGSSDGENDGVAGMICEDPEPRETSVSLKSSDGEFGRSGRRRVGRSVDLGEVLDWGRG